MVPADRESFRRSGNLIGGEAVRFQVSEPDVICFSAAISACKKAGEWKFAVQLLQEMEDQVSETLWNYSCYSV